MATFLNDWLFQIYAFFSKCWAAMKFVAAFTFETDCFRGDSIYFSTLYLSDLGWTRAAHLSTLLLDKYEVPLKVKIRLK